MVVKKVRSIFISDIHFGCKFSRAEDLYNFLELYPKPKFLYLVGDIIDGWRISKKGIYWTFHYTCVFRKILGMMKKHNTIVRYVTGNHDEFLRNFISDELISDGNLEIANRFIHRTNNNQNLLVIHGDQFDSFTKHCRFIAYLGDTLYNLALWLNYKLNTLRRKLGLRYWSLSGTLKKKVKKAASYINNFEELLTRHAQHCGCEGVICGHIHTPTIKVINDILYLNCGDWIEHCTGLVEYEDGSLELVWHHN